MRVEIEKWIFCQMKFQFNNKILVKDDSQKCKEK